VGRGKSLVFFKILAITPIPKDMAWNTSGDITLQQKCFWKIAHKFLGLFSNAASNHKNRYTHVCRFQACISYIQEPCSQ
jgi:hypothetical protein